MPKRKATEKEAYDALIKVGTNPADAHAIARMYALGSGSDILDYSSIVDLAIKQANAPDHHTPKGCDADRPEDYRRDDGRENDEGYDFNPPGFEG